MRKIKLRMIIPPNKIEIWEQELLLDSEALIVSKFLFKNIPKPVKINGKIAIDKGFTGILFEFCGENLEIIKVLDKRGKLTGYYCNINTPPKRFSCGYEITDLFLDVWVFPNLKHILLDEGEFLRAAKEGWIDAEMSRIAKRVLRSLIKKLGKGDFPPRVVEEYS